MNAIAHAIQSSKERISQDGIWPHSKPGQYFIFQIGDDEATLENFIVWAARNMVGVKPLIAHDNGKVFTSFIANYEHLNLIMPHLIGQTAIVHLSAFVPHLGRLATFISLTGDEIQPRGFMKEITADQATHRPRYFFDPALGTYFAT